MTPKQVTSSLQLFDACTPGALQTLLPTTYVYAVPVTNNNGATDGRDIVRDILRGTNLFWDCPFGQYAKQHKPHDEAGSTTKNI